MNVVCEWACESENKCALCRSICAMSKAGPWSRCNAYVQKVLNWRERKRERGWVCLEIQVRARFNAGCITPRPKNNNDNLKEKGNDSNVVKLGSLWWWYWKRRSHFRKGSLLKVENWSTRQWIIPIENILKRARKSCANVEKGVWAGGLCVCVCVHNDWC